MSNTLKDLKRLAAAVTFQAIRDYFDPNYTQECEMFLRENSETSRYLLRKINDGTITEETARNMNNQTLF